MKHTIVMMDSVGNTIHEYPASDDWSATVERCGQLNEANEKSGSSIGGYEVVSERDDE